MADPRSRVLCKYYMHGACRYRSGECPFSHDTAVAPSYTCKYFLQGHCAYGDACRYDHIRPSWAQPAAAAAPARATPGGATATKASQGQQGGASTGSTSAAPGGPAPVSRAGSSASTTLGGAVALARGGSSLGLPEDPWESTSAGAGAGAHSRSSSRPALLPGGPAMGGSASPGPGPHSAEEEQQEGAGGGAHPRSAREGWAQDPWQQQQQWVGGLEGVAEEEALGTSPAAALGAPHQQHPATTYGDVLRLGGGAGSHPGGAAWGGEQQGAGGYGGGEGGDWWGQQQGEGDPAAEGWGHEEGQQWDESWWQGAGAEGYDEGWGAQHDDGGFPADEGALLPEGDGGGGGGVGAALAGLSAEELAARPLCTSHSMYGQCVQGARCRMVHGDLCSSCGKHMIHPHNAEEAAAHRAECGARHARLQARLRSNEVECGICYEKVRWLQVLSHANPADRKFGLLACDHAFCLGCIRTWRSTGTADIDTAVRTCPQCRTTSFFITPSLVWPADADEKQRIVDQYKTKLSTIDCRHFDKGNGTCPFGTSCFYRHQYRDGTLESREVNLRLAKGEAGETHVVRGQRLSDFLDVSRSAQQLLGGGGGAARRGAASGGGTGRRAGNRPQPLRDVLGQLMALDVASEASGNDAAATDEPAGS